MPGVTKPNLSRVSRTLHHLPRFLTASGAVFLISESTIIPPVQTILNDHSYLQVLIEG